MDILNEQHINDILNSEANIFTKITKKVSKLNKLNDIIHATLPNTLGKVCRVGTLEQGCLILYVENSSWHAKLRYETLTLLSEIRAYPDFSGVATIQCKVKPLDNPTSKAKDHKKPLINHTSRLSEDIATCIQQTASTITDPSIRAALIQLATNTSQQMQLIDK